MWGKTKKDFPTQINHIQKIWDLWLRILSKQYNFLNDFIKDKNNDDIFVNFN